MAMKYRSAALMTAGAIALILVTSGTTAYAAKTLITGSDIARGTITGANIATGTIDSTDIKNKSITAADIKPGTISLSHINKGSIKAGHVHAGASVLKVDPKKVVSAAQFEPNSIGTLSTIRAMNSNSGVNLTNGVFTTAGTIRSLPAGTYVIQASGTIFGSAVSNGSTTYYETSVSCQLLSGTNSFSWVGFGPGVSAQHSGWTSTVAMTKVVSTSSAADMSVSCKALNTHGEPGVWADIDIIALPVTSVSAG